jgi:hypothetical protein
MSKPMATLVFRWEEVLEALGPHIQKMVPEARGRRLRFNGGVVDGGIRLELYDEKAIIAPPALVRAT